MESASELIERYGTRLLPIAAVAGLAIGVVGRNLLELILTAVSVATVSSPIDCSSDDGGCVFVQAPAIILALARGFLVAALAGVAMLAVALILLSSAWGALRQEDTEMSGRALWYTGIGAALLVAASVVRLDPHHRLTAALI